VLLALHAWRAKGLSRVVAALPESDRLRTQTRKEVEAKAACARAAVTSSTGDMGEAEAALAELALLAEAYDELDFEQSAGAAVSDLRQLVELRSASLDDTLRVSLEEGRFSYMRDYIAPLLKAKDALKREKLSRALTAAAEMLREKFESAQKSVPNASQVAEAVRLLSDAGKHIGAQLVKHQSFDALETASLLRERVTEHMTKLVDRLEAALAALNYVQVFEQAAWTAEYLEKAGAMLVVDAAPPRAAKGKGARAQRPAEQRPAEAVDTRKRAEEVVAQA
jgi:hypothetical protein